MGNFKERNNWINKMFEHITSFQKKQDLFDGQFSNSVLTHFPCLKSRKEEGVVINCEKYGTMIKTLCAVFGDRFSNFRNLEVDFNIFSDPFNTVVDQSPDHLEAIDLQSDNDMKKESVAKTILWAFIKIKFERSIRTFPNMPWRSFHFLEAPVVANKFFQRWNIAKESTEVNCQTNIWTSSCLQFYVSKCSKTL